MSSGGIFLLRPTYWLTQKTASFGLGPERVKALEQVKPVTQMILPTGCLWQTQGAWGIYLWHTGELHGASAEQSAVCSFWKVLIWKMRQENPECGTKRYAGQQVTISLLRHSPLTCHWALGQSKAWLQHTRWPCWPSGKGAVRPTQPQTGVATITRQTRQDGALKA